jgi:hypothetical protein
MRPIFDTKCRKVKENVDSATLAVPGLETPVAAFQAAQGEMPV